MFIGYEGHPPSYPQNMRVTLITRNEVLVVLNSSLNGVIIFDYYLELYFIYSKGF